MVQIVRAVSEFDNVHAAADSHVDIILLSTSVTESLHVDRMILAIGHTGAGTDDVTKVRIYSMPNDVVATDLSPTFPDDIDTNVWFKQVIYGSTPVYVSWRPKRTLKAGEILYLDTTAVQHAATHEAYGYLQTLYHFL